MTHSAAIPAGDKTSRTLLETWPPLPRPLLPAPRTTTAPAWAKAVKEGCRRRRGKRGTMLHLRLPLWPPGDVTGSTACVCGAHGVSFCFVAGRTLAYISYRIYSYSSIIRSTVIITATPTYTPGTANTYLQTLRCRKFSNECLFWCESQPVRAVQSSSLHSCFSYKFFFRVHV